MDYYRILPVKKLIITGKANNLNGLINAFARELRPAAADRL